MFLNTPLIAWMGNDHTLAGRGIDGRAYLIEDQDGDVLVWIDDAPLLDVFDTMDAAREAAETMAFVQSGRLSPVDAINARIGAFA